MPIESNTSSDLGQDARDGFKKTNLIKSYSHGETRRLVPPETPRERMVRVIRAVRKKKL